VARAGPRTRLGTPNLYICTIALSRAGGARSCGSASLPRPWEASTERDLLHDALEQVEIADRVGFDYVWEVEHHFLEEYSHSSAPEVFLAAAAARTKRIRLGHGIIQIPPRVNHPARVAERVATLDLVSDGRVDFGTGNASSQAELGGFGVDRQLKREMWQEALDAITRMFVEVPFAGWDGEYVRMPPRNVVPKPLQKPHPPLWVACSRRETIHLAAQNGIGALSFSFVEPEDAGKWVGEYYDIIASEDCVPAGFSVNPNVSVVLPMMMAEDEAEAIDRGIDGAHFFGYSLAHYYGMDHLAGVTDVHEEFLRRRDETGFARHIVTPDSAPLGVRLLQEGLGSLRGAIGTPAQVIELCRRYENVGVDQIVFVLQSGTNRHEHICESLELFGREVLPAFTEGRERREAEKAERLAPAIERAELARAGRHRRRAAGSPRELVRAEPGRKRPRAGHVDDRDRGPQGDGARRERRRSGADAEDEPRGLHARRRRRRGPGDAVPRGPRRLRGGLRGRRSPQRDVRRALAVLGKHPTRAGTHRDTVRLTDPTRSWRAR
jgi:alkanesulfonate monooxygenase SsuD/methylene tetrahydromethanopterin reductase-like flavin-dependent oxidoreductase (luciferase family)